MADRNTLLAILELDCAPDTLIDRSAWIAKAFSLDVHLVLYAPDSGALLGGFSLSNEADRIRESIHQGQKVVVEEYADKLRDAGLEVTTGVLQLRPLGDGVLNIAKFVNPKLVVKSTTSHSAAERSVLVDSDWQLMRICPYPLWFAKSDSMPEKPTIVAAVDPSNANDKPAVLDHEIVRSAKVVADATDGEVQLVHVYERLAGINKAAMRAINPEVLPIDEIDARIKAEHRSALDALTSDCGLDAEQAHQLPGRTHEIIPTFVRTRKTGLLVMGALARWGIKKMVIGSTTERVIDHVDCDILIVRLSEYQLYD
jgi:universal stress protein E